MPSADTQFKPGNKGGTGRPHKATQFRATIESLPQTIKDQLLTCPISGERVTPEQLCVIALLIQVKKGNIRAIIELGNRLFGKPHKSVDVDLEAEPAEPLVLVREPLSDTDLAWAEKAARDIQAANL